MSFFFSPFLIPFLKAEKWYGTQVERSDWKYNAKYKNIAAITVWLCLQTALQLCTLGLHQWSLSPLHSGPWFLCSASACGLQSIEMLSASGSPSSLGNVRMELSHSSLFLQYQQLTNKFLSSLWSCPCAKRWASREEYQAGWTER